jgi:hypothetical protein
MAHHGSESFFVVGEGLLSTSGEGRQPVVAATDTAAQVVPPFRFSRMGPKGTQLARAQHQKMAVAMTRGGGGSGNIPAGFTYLGQFVDHDLTFDRTDVALGTNVSPSELLQGRSPSLDLDSLYGAGPQDPESADFYRDGLHLRVGTTGAIGDIPAKAGHDLPRLGGSGSAEKKRKAVIPDHRNDENLAVAQTHLAFIRFHNRVVDSLPRSTPDAQRFARARDIVVRHYQWMLRTDYLPRLMGKGAVNDVFGKGRKAFEVAATPTDVPTMPIEFSVAAFRLGHSMVRREYDWNKRFPSGQGTLALLFEFSGTGGRLGGSLELPSNWIADFRRLYDFKEAGRTDLAPPPGEFNRARRIDTRLATTLHELPPGSLGGEQDEAIQLDLAFRNLRRAKMVRLATGQQMARFLKDKGVKLTELTKAQIRDGKNGANLDALTSAQREKSLKHTPLWFYILREAEFNDGKLNGVGARIVAETFHRAMEGSTSSIVRDPAWRPNLGPDRSTFRMVDLLLFAFEGKKTLLAPLG